MIEKAVSRGEWGGKLETHVFCLIRAMHVPLLLLLQHLQPPHLLPPRLQRPLDPALRLLLASAVPTDVDDDADRGETEEGVDEGLDERWEFE